MQPSPSMSARWSACLVSQRLLGGHVVDRAHDVARVGQPVVVVALAQRAVDTRQAHVENLDRPFLSSSKFEG